MKIRHRVALWITGAGVLTSLLFSLIVFFEMLEQPYHQLDSELNAVTGFVADFIQIHPPPQAGSPPARLSEALNRYWIRVFDKDRHVVCQSALAEMVDLPLRAEGAGYLVEKIVSKERFDLEQDRKGEVAFWVKVVGLPGGASGYRLQIAKPVEKLEEELSDLLIVLGLGLAFSILMLVLLSYWIAGKIVRPIGEISRRARRIDEKHLDQRIALGPSRDELYDLSSALNRMFDRLQYSFERQKQFIASAAHELKSPIAILRLFFDEAVSRPDLPHALLRRLAAQGQILARMDRLVKTLLMLSALEQKTSPALEAVDLAQTAAAIVDEFAPLIEAKRIRLDVNIPEKMILAADPDQLRRLLINILDNAVKYNRQGGQIRLEARRTGDDVCIALFNTGLGIPPEDLERVFEQFYRVEPSRSLRHGGSGLGLSIVRQIVRLHRGNVSMQSEPGKWACIRIVLPLGARQIAFCG